MVYPEFDCDMKNSPTEVTVQVDRDGGKEYPPYTIQSTSDNVDIDEN